jgi:hypothetical protein
LSGTLLKLSWAFALKDVVIVDLLDELRERRDKKWRGRRTL